MIFKPDLVFKTRWSAATYAEITPKQYRVTYIGGGIVHQDFYTDGKRARTHFLSWVKIANEYANGRESLGH